MMINTVVGKRIQNRRKELNVSSSRIALQLGMTEQYYLKLENGYTKITVDELICIAIILKVSPQSLLLKSTVSQQNRDSQLNNYYH